ncbi:MAG: 23S rRNA pseudouridine(955/2504/2580) synthase RluC [Halieaceae bacterium]|nr:23S rRNA pseudouridine(955/2504/2580) synthase RluC [Halieaceae bacterium]
MSQVRFIEVSADYQGQRLDNFLLRELRGVPKTRIYKALRKGEIRVNKGRVRGDYRVAEGDSVRIPPLRTAEREEPSSVPRRWAGLLEEQLIYEDQGLWVLNKPSGLAVHGGSGLAVGMIECLRKLAPEERFLELVHRLDRDTSGCIMVARKPAVLKSLHRLLREDRVDKRYLALVAGRWSAKRSFVEAPLKKNTLKSGERIVRVDREGKAARTEFSVVERFDTATLVEAKPVTGRTHQIRVHCLQAGHPILGDEKYGDREANKQAADLGLKRLFLHAAGLSLSLDGERLSLSAPLDENLEVFLQRLRK